MREFGQLETVPVKEVWPNEASNFTPWVVTDEGLKLLGWGFSIFSEMCLKYSRTAKRLDKRESTRFVQRVRSRNSLSL